MILSFFPRLYPPYQGVNLVQTPILLLLHALNLAHLLWSYTVL